MNILNYFLITIEVISSLLLIFVILLQRSKNYGSGMAFGAGMGEQLFGGQVGNVLTRVTVWLLAIFLFTTTALAYLGAKKAKTGDEPFSDSSSSVNTTAPVPVPVPVPVAQQNPVSVPAPAPAVTAPAPVIPLDAKPVQAPAITEVKPVEVKPADQPKQDAAPVQPAQ